MAQPVSGTVSEATDGLPLVGANVYWLGTTQGTATDSAGTFTLPRHSSSDRLVVSFIGFVSDTIGMEARSTIAVSLAKNHALEEVEIARQQAATEVAYLNPIKVEKISVKELQKAACCNLSESFETSPTVDVSFTDAVTGTRQIQLLGLAGPYTQINRENIPDVRGLSVLSGLTYTPGTWIEGIQLNKGTGSVVNGFEGIAGQINVELQKPTDADRLFLNVYGNEAGRLEANAQFAHRFASEKWSTGLLLHGVRNRSRQDRNDDGFLDNPLSDRYVVLHRWNYVGDQGLRWQMGVKGVSTELTGGQEDFEPTGDEFAGTIWGMHQDVKRLEAWSKLGWVSEALPWKSTGLQLSGVFHESDHYFGPTTHDARQWSLYANWVYQSILFNTNHRFKAGASFQWDDYEEDLNATNFDRTEVVPGAFFEYTYTQGDRFGAVAGLRADHHNQYGGFLTPRVHLRYALSEDWILRASGGKGQRTANVIAENSGILASARQVMILGDGSDKPYGLDPEVAWNVGFNVVYYFRLLGREGRVSFDAYRTDFTNQIVVDLDQDPQQALFYNLPGSSYANSLQLQVDHELLRNLFVRMAYRWYDVQTDYLDAQREKPLIARHRAFLNLAYETGNRWKFDATVNWQGAKRIPFTGSNPEAFQLDERSPDFTMVHVQVTKVFSDHFEAYLGVENLFNFRQQDAIIASGQPFSPFFDSSLIWGPVFGRNSYAGLRYRIP